MDKSLKCKARDTIKLLEENIGRTLFDINGSKILFDSLPRVMEIKTKIKKWFLIKLKSFCAKRKPQKFEKTNLRTGEKVKVKVTQSCLTLCNPMDCTVYGSLQTRILKRVAFSRGSSQPRD